ncbi:unnamed protein product [Amoebophrya sp. A120]|nr:unnamed protein product [Amoebophrya sp. A120]|eukprot:GSA120T00000468001.1
MSSREPRPSGFRGSIAGEEEAQKWYEGENDFYDERESAGELYRNLMKTLLTPDTALDPGAADIMDQPGALALGAIDQKMYRDDGTFVSPGEFPAHSVSWWVGGEPEDLMSVMEGGVSAEELDAITKGPAGWLRLSRWNGEVNGEGAFLPMEVLPALGQNMNTLTAFYAAQLQQQQDQFGGPNQASVPAATQAFAAQAKGALIAPPKVPDREKVSALYLNLGKVFQGNITNGYFIDALNALSTRPHLVYDVFMQDGQQGLLSCVAKGFYQFRLYKHANWVSVIVDDYLPQHESGFIPLGCRSEHFPQFAWSSLIEKAYAKLHNSFLAMGKGGNIEEALEDLTGGLGSRFYVHDVAADRLFAYLEFSLRQCLFVAKLDQEKAGSLRLKLDPEWAYVVVDTLKISSSKQAAAGVVGRTTARPPMRSKPTDFLVCLFVNCPFNEVLHEITALPDHPRYQAKDGYLWMEILVFHQVFRSIHECRLVNTSDLESTWIPAWKALGSDLAPTLVPRTYGASPPPRQLEEQIWCFPSFVTSENWPVFKIEVTKPRQECEIFIGVGQSDKRLGGYLSSEDCHSPIFLKLYEEMGLNLHSASSANGSSVDVSLVTVSNWGHTRDAALAVKVKPDETTPDTTILYLSAAVCGDTPAFRLVARFYSIGSPLLIEEVSGRVKQKLPQLVEIVADRRLATIPYSFAGWSSNIEPRRSSRGNREGVPRPALPGGDVGGRGNFAAKTSEACAVRCGTGSCRGRECRRAKLHAGGLIEAKTKQCPFGAQRKISINFMAGSTSGGSVTIVVEKSRGR